jgi:7,8-dihydropterin-6-yl-methyl-4-(beta-D-ribofuranosyl)aminobenzene 5'-phosphate synthase
MFEHHRKKLYYAVFLIILLIGGLIVGCINDVTRFAATSSGQTNPATTTILTSSYASTAHPAATTSFSTATTATEHSITKPSETSEEETSCPTDSSHGIEYELKLTIIYDNNNSDPDLKADWGFSCLIEGLEHCILFDAGDDSAILLDNMKELKIDPTKIDCVVLSHNHSDHTGGLKGFLKENSHVTVYLPASCPDSFKDMIQSYGAKIGEVSGARELFAGIYNTGELGGEILEQSLIITTSKGLVIMTGCAHPGLVNIVRQAKDILAEEPVYLVLGGFHMAWETNDQIESVMADLRQLGVKKVAPCHCSGDETRKIFQTGYGQDYIDCGVGKIIIIP